MGKVFVVESSKAVLRNRDLTAQKYKPGDDIPAGKNVGDERLIPQRTAVAVTDVKTDEGRHTYVLVRPANVDGAAALGWTSCANLEGSFANETAGLAPSNWDLEPQGSNKTCVDGNTLIRGGPPDFVSTASTIPQKTFVLVTDTSADGKTVKVNRIEIVNGAIKTMEELGWTRLSNLRDGCSDLYFSAEWNDNKGPNACWDHGDYIGPKLLVNIVGYGGEMEQVTLDSLDAYLKLKDAAAEESNIGVSINSAFRTYQRQADLRHLFDIGKGNNAAKPGRSNHQHGQAFDLNTGHNIFDGSDKVYEWLKKNAPKHGFVRAVSKESWHWEYRPAEAAQLAAAGKFRLPGVED
jgi:hypothetical protein